MCLVLKEYENTIIILIIYKVLHINPNHETKNGHQCDLQLLTKWDTSWADLMTTMYWSVETSTIDSSISYMYISCIKLDVCKHCQTDKNVALFKSWFNLPEINAMWLIANRYRCWLEGEVCVERGPCSTRKCGAIKDRLLFNVASNKIKTLNYLKVLEIQFKNNTHQ